MEKLRDKFLEIERQKILEAAKITLERPEGKEILDYLIDERKLPKEIIEQFEVGYCPQDVYNVDYRIRGKIITPIYDAYNNLIVLTTRHLNKSHSNRFWHESFDKGSYLYGLPYSIRAIVNTNRVILVEGEFDVMALHSNGFKMTVGMCGSALTLFQIALLAKYCSYFYLLFDGDQPGKRAIERAMKLYDEYYLISYGIHFIPVYLDNNMDPDDFIKKFGKEKLKEKLKIAKEEYEILN